MDHVPVLLKECIDGLMIKPTGVYVDGTLGRGGHALEIAKRLSRGKLIAIDRDHDAISHFSMLINNDNELKNKIVPVHGNFKDISKILSGNNFPVVDGMLFDLGVSSPQLDDIKRGFSYMFNARLDMRMNTKDDLSAYEIINTWSSHDLTRIFFEYGEERYSKSIANAIVKKREIKLIETTFDLNEIIFSAMPAAARRELQHPSKRCFQALRIAVNDELNSISLLLDEIPNCLRSKGRVCVISFHSLEDRLAKTSFAKNTKTCICPADAPVCICNVKPTLKQITKKPIIPTTLEVEKNPRARSAKLRIAERI